MPTAQAYNPSANGLFGLFIQLNIDAPTDVPYRDVYLTLKFVDHNTSKPVVLACSSLRLRDDRIFD